MPGFLLNVTSTVLCAHGTGQATALTPAPRVLVDGQPALTLSSAMVVAGCANPPPAGGPCITANWTIGATRVFASKQPVLLQDGQALCAPTGVPLTVAVAQPRVRGQ